MGTLQKTTLRGLQSSERHQDLNLDFKANVFFQESEQALVLISATVSHRSDGNTEKSWFPGKDLRLMGIAFSEDGQAESVFSQTLPLATGNAESAVQGFLKLKPGKYRIKLVAADRQGRLATTETDFVVKRGLETAASGDVPSPVIAGQTRAEKASGPEAVAGLDLKKIRDNLEIPRSSGRTTPELAYRFRGDILACADDQGELGYNPDVADECGDLRGSQLQSQALKGKNLFGANLSGMDLRKADLRDAVLLRADLTQTRLWEADLRGADLRGANLSGAELMEARLDGAQLQGADLTDASLTQASLEGADLRGADLRRAILKNARLNQANLQVADLSEAVLFGSDLSRTDLRGTRMTQAALVDGMAADLPIIVSSAGRIRIGRTRFAGARYDESTQLPFDSQQAENRKMQADDTPSAFYRPEFMMEPGSEEFAVSGSAWPTLGSVQPGGVPTGAEWPDFLEAVRRGIDATSQNLPNFVCRRRTERFERLFRGWQEKDRLQEELRFTNGEESYQPVEGQKASGSRDGTYSIGEFAAALRNVFARESRTSFRPEEAEEISGRQTVRIAYRVPQEASSLQLNYEGNPLRVGYRGLCWIDVNTYQVVRLTKEMVDLPEDFPIKTSEMSIAYDRIRIGGRQHWLPVRAQFNMSVGILQSVRVHTRNIIRFTDYRQFETDVKLLLE